MIVARCFDICRPFARLRFFAVRRSNVFEVLRQFVVSICGKIIKNTSSH